MLYSSLGSTALVVPMQKYNTSIGSGNRITIPGEVLQSNPDLTNNRGMYLAFMGDGCLGLCTPEQFEELYNAIQGSGEDAVNIKRSLHSRSRIRKISSDGRVRIPNPKKYGFESGEVTILESEGRIRIWDSVIYQNQVVSAQPSGDLALQKSIS